MPPPGYPPIRLSPARLRKLIARHPDPLVSKELLDLTISLDPTFLSSPTSYPPIHALILRLASSNHHTFAFSLLRRVPSPSPGLFSSLLTLLSSSPSLSLSTFRHLSLHHPSLLRPRHLNRLLLSLSPHPNLLPTSLSLFNSSLLPSSPFRPNTASLNTILSSACRANRLSIAYSLFNRALRCEVVPNAESYRILMQGLCRKSQVNSALDLLDDMLNKGIVPDAFGYTTLLNSLCRKRKLREAYKLLCRMKVKGCNPDVVHYNTVICGFCREGRPWDACKVIDDMPENGCLPNLVSYTLLVNGLCGKGLLEEAKGYLERMVGSGLVPHFTVLHGLVRGFCDVGKVEEACEVMGMVLKLGVVPHVETWVLVVPRVCDDEEETLGEAVEKVRMTDEEWRRSTRIVESASGLEEYYVRRFKERKTRK